VEFVIFHIFVIKLNWGSFVLVCVSLVSETIPRHRDYRTSPQSKKELLRKVNFQFSSSNQMITCCTFLDVIWCLGSFLLSLQKLLTSVIELEKLKPLAQQKINELNSRKSYQHNGRENFRSNYSTDISPVKKQTMASYNQIKVKCIRQINMMYICSFSGTHFLLFTCSLPPLKKFCMNCIHMIFYTRPGSRSNCRRLCLPRIKGSAVFLCKACGR
jgi:hypothetical protein